MLSCRVLSAGGLSSAVLAISVAGAQAPRPYVCMTRDFAKRIGYVSPIFNMLQTDAPKANTAWGQLMTSQYGITALPFVSCQGPYPDVATANDSRSAYMKQVQASFGKPVVDVAWTYNGVPAVTYTAQPAAPPAPPAPAPAPTITAADRAAFQAEVPQSKAYCEQNFKGLYNCDGFAQAVLDHRLANPGEFRQDKASAPERPPVHDLVAGVQLHLDCTKCLDDQLLSSWAHNSVETNFSAAVIAKAITKAKVDAFADCVAKQFVPRVHAKPEVGQIRNVFNDASVACGNPNQ